MSQAKGHVTVSNPLMFWLLTSMAVVAAVPCFLVRPIEAYHGLLALEQRQLQTIEHLQTRLVRQETLSRALRSDPQVNTRLAQRELGYRQPGAIGHVTGPAEIQTPRFDTQNLAPSTAKLPTWMALLYPKDWAHVYRMGTPRRIILCLSLGLILFALGVYSPRPAQAGA